MGLTRYKNKVLKKFVDLTVEQEPQARQDFTIH